MYTQEIVCPSCSQMAIVNVLDKKGQTNSCCQKCGERIYVRTDEDGKVEGVSKCLIATACLHTQADVQKSSMELDAIRHYRDTYIQSLSFGQALLEDYY